MTSRSIALVLSRAYPPYAEARAAEDRLSALEAEGYPVEVIAESPDGDEFTHLDRAGRLVHRINPERSYLLKALRKPWPVRLPSPVRVQSLAYAARVAEKALELAALWGRPIARIDNVGPSGDARLLQLVPLRSGRAADPRRSDYPEVRSAELVVCTYNRVDDLERSLPTLLGEAERARAHGIPCRIQVVHQNEWLPSRIDPKLRSAPHVDWVFSSPPGLPRARNAGLRGATADLVIFVDDDVLLDEGFVLEHVAAANAHRSAVGVVGRARSRIEGARRNERSAVGQIRLSGAVDANFDSIHDRTTLVPHTPLGANMSFRREAMNALLGPAWFDARLEGSAHREESTLTMQLYRRGEHLVYAPRAALYHFEAENGGCENRGARSAGNLLAHRALDYLFLHRLYEPLGAGQALAPWLLFFRDLHHAPDVRTKLEEGVRSFRAYFRGRRIYREHRHVDTR